LSLKKQKSTIFLGNEFSEEISFCYIPRFYQGFVFFFFGFCDIVTIGNHPQEGFISVTSNQNWDMGIFWNSLYGCPWTISKTISEISISLSSLIISFFNNDLFY